MATAGHRRALPGARLDRTGSRRPPRLGSTPPQHLGALPRRHPLWLGHRPRADLGLRTRARASRHARARAWGGARQRRSPYMDCLAEERPTGGRSDEVSSSPAALCPGTSQGPAPWQRRLQRADGLLHASRLMLRPSNTRARPSHRHAPDDLPLTSPSLVGSLEATCPHGGGPTALRAIAVSAFPCPLVGMKFAHP